MSWLKNIVKDVGSIAKNVVTKPVEAITGKNIYTPSYTTGLGSVAGKLTNFTTGITTTAGAAITRSVVGAGISGGSVKAAGAASGQSLISNFTANPVAAVQQTLAPAVPKSIPAPVVEMPAAPMAAPAETMKREEVKHLTNQLMTNIGTSPGAAIPTVSDFTSNLNSSAEIKTTSNTNKDDNWFERNWQKLKIYFRDKPTEAWSITGGIVVLLGLVVWLITKPKKKGGRGYGW
jgi:hypothetical protein